MNTDLGNEYSVNWPRILAEAKAARLVEDDQYLFVWHADGSVGYSSLEGRYEPIADEE